MTEEEKTETEKVEVIKLNEKTRNMLMEINKTVSMLQNQAQIAIQSYLDALEKSGQEYALGPDMTMLIPKNTKHTP